MIFPIDVATNTAKNRKLLMQAKFELGLSIVCDTCKREFTNKDTPILYNWTEYFFCSKECMQKEKRKFAILILGIAIIIIIVSVLIIAS